MGGDDVKKSVVDLLGDALPDFTQGPRETTVNNINSPTIRIDNLNLTVAQYINQPTKITIKPGVEHITHEQAAKLKSLVDQIASWECRVRPWPMSFGKIWKIFNRRMGVTSYRLTTKEQFEEAREFLEGWVRLLSLLAEPPREDKDWYIRRYAVLFTQIGQLGLSERFNELLSTEYQVKSMTDLSARDLVSVYRTVSGWIYDAWKKI